MGNWMVAEVDGRVVGIGSLLEMGPALVEVRSLAVLPEYRRYGVGGVIVQALVSEAQQRGYPTVFALTRAVSFFERQGFVVTEHERFPEKYAENQKHVNSVGRSQAPVDQIGG